MTIVTGVLVVLGLIIIFIFMEQNTAFYCDVPNRVAETMKDKQLSFQFLT